LYQPLDDADALSCRPDFTMLVYPGYFTGKQRGTIAPEVAVARDKTPPTLIVQTEDDPVHVENALWYFEALKQAGVPAEMHLYPTGGHGYGLRRTSDEVTTWPDRAADWLRANGWLAPRH
jgi:acetyl esterase/lipase